MKIARLSEVCAIAIAIVALPAVGRIGLGPRGVHAAAVAVVLSPAAMPMPLGLPSEQDAKAVLNASLRYHHPQWVDVPMGAVNIRTFVIYPDLAGAAPVVVVTAKDQGMSDWARAVGTEVVTQGLIAVVPDLLSGAGPDGGGTASFASREAVAAAFARMRPSELQRRTNAVRDYFLSRPGANGSSAILDFNLPDARLDAAISTPARQRVVKFDLTAEHAWHNALPLLMNLARPAPALPQAQSAAPAVSMDKDALAAANANQTQAQKAIAARSDIPPQSWGGKRMADTSPRKGQWIDIPVKTELHGTINMHTWLVQPLGNEKAGVVVVIQPSPGMDVGEDPKKGAGANWMRAVADMVALQGFIVIMPDLTSGMGPNGGNFDSFLFSDDQFLTLPKRPVSERMEFVRAARDYAEKLPRANGKSGTLGFCSGGGLSWQAAADDVPGLNAAVSFYGTPPNPATMAKIQAPVIAFAGDQDPGLAPLVAAAAPDMQKLGKTFEFKIYPGATHAYVYEQHLAQNAAATLDSWPRSMEFLKRYVSGT